MIKLESSKNEIFEFYRTPTDFTSPIHPPQVTTINEEPFVMVPARNTFYIYNLQDLTLQFLGPTFSYDAILNDQYNTFIADKSAIHVVHRGEIAYTHLITESEREGGVENCDGDTMKKSRDTIKKSGDTAPLPPQIRQMKKFGDYLIVIINDTTLLTLESTIIEDQGLKFFIREDHRQVSGKKITNILHPHGFVNKILISYEDKTVDLFNIQKKKAIFTFRMESQVVQMEQTGSIGTVGFLMDNGCIALMNIKTGKRYFEIDSYVGKDKIQSMSFKDRYLMIILDDGRTGNNNQIDGSNNQIDGSNNQIDREATSLSLAAANKAIIYDLEMKREVFRINRVYSGAFINSEMFLITTESSVAIYTVDDFQVLKQRQTITGNIRGMEKLSDRESNDKEFVLYTNQQIFKMNVYRDELNTFLKSSSMPGGGVLLNRTDAVNGIESLDAVNGIESLDVKESIVLYRNGQICGIREGKYFLILETKCDWVKTHRDLCMFCKKNRVFLIHERSQRVILTIEEKGEIKTGDFDDGKIVLCVDEGGEHDGTENDEKGYKIKGYNYNKDLLFVYERIGGHENLRVSAGSSLTKKHNLKIFNQLLILQITDYIFIIFEGMIKAYEGTSYSIDSTCKFMTTTLGRSIILYDILSGEVVEAVKFDKNLKDVLILSNLKFLVLLDEENQVHLLSNSSQFRKDWNEYLVSATAETAMKIEKEKSTFYKQMLRHQDAMSNSGAGAKGNLELDLRVKGLNMDEIMSLLEEIESSMLKELERNASKNNRGENETLNGNAEKQHSPNDDSHPNAVDSGNNFYEALNVLNKLLRYRGKDLEKCDMARIREIVARKWEECDKKYTKCLGYLKMAEDIL